MHGYSLLYSKGIVIIGWLYYNKNMAGKQKVYDPNYIVKLLDQGLTWKDINEKHNITNGNIQRWLARNKIRMTVKRKWDWERVK